MKCKGVPLIIRDYYTDNFTNAAEHEHGLICLDMMQRSNKDSEKAGILIF